MIQELIRFRMPNEDDEEYKWRTLNLSSYLSLKDETQLSMNQSLLQIASKLLSDSKDSNLKLKVQEL